MTEKPSTHALWHNFFRPKVDWAEDTARLCEKNMLFKGLSPAVIRWFAARMHPRSYAAGEIIFHCGDEGSGAILVRSGSIKIHNEGVQLALIEAGDMFGEVALVGGQSRTAEAVAMASCDVVFLLRADLDDWMKSHPKHAAVFLKNLSRMLATRLNESNKAISASLDEDAKQ